MPTKAAKQLRSWSEVLPKFTSEDIATHSRVLLATDQLRELGPRLGLPVSEALAPWWPYLGQGDFTLHLQLRGAEGDQQEFQLRQTPVRIGRGEGSHIQLPSPTVSTDHTEIRVERGVVSAMDLRSTNGTRRNGIALDALKPVALQPGDRIEIGPFTLTFMRVDYSEPEQLSLDARAGPIHTLRQAHPFRLLTQPSDRWVKVLVAGHTVWLRVPVQWIRACWQRVTELRFDDGLNTTGLEDGAAIYILEQVTHALAARLQIPLQLCGWLSSTDADRLTGDVLTWLEADIWIGRPPVELATTVLVAIEDWAVSASAPEMLDLSWPASVCAGYIRLKQSDWEHLDPGDALLPDVWLADRWTEMPTADGPLGGSAVRVGRFWHEGQLRREGGQLKLTVERPWIDTPGGGWFMAERDTGAAGSIPASVQELELQVVIELDRVPVTLGQLQTWKAGHCITLQRGPEDPIRLVLETPVQRRVLAEGRVVVVDGRLGIEIVRLLTSATEGAK